MAKKQEVVVEAPVKTTKKKSTEVAVRKNTEVGAVGDWKKELEKYAERAKATAVMALGNWFSVKQARLTFKGAEIQDGEMDGIILDVMLENAYYGDKPFDPDDPKPPVCFALGYDVDEMKPHANSSEPQNENCPTCEWNKFGTGGLTGKGKACKNIRRIALISGGDITADGIHDADIGRMKVPVTSVAQLNAHINNIKAKLGTEAPFVTVTHISVEPHAKHQVQVNFGFPDPKNLKMFPDKVMPSILGRVKEAEEQLAEPYQARAEEEEKPKKSAPGKKKKF